MAKAKRQRKTVTRKVVRRDYVTGGWAAMRLDCGHEQIRRWTWKRQHHEGDDCRCDTCAAESAYERQKEVIND